MNNGPDEADRAIRELFAEPHAEVASDPLFVAGVMSRIARRRRLRTAAGAGIAAVLVGTLLSSFSSFSAPLVESTDVVASLPVLLTVPFQDFLSSPIGLAMSLPLGILLITLSTLRLNRFGE